jgi:selenocysteine-specific elongation factor
VLAPHHAEDAQLGEEEFLRGTFLDKPSPIVAVSSLTGAGLDELKRAMVVAATEVRPRDSQAIARLPIDRVFTMKGFGTVVTGTLVAGTIRREDELEVFPSGRSVRVRGAQVHGQMADAAVAGQRTALNLAGASTEDLSRGMTLAPVTTLTVTRRVDVRLRLLPTAPRPLKSRTRVHFHCNTMETVVEIALHGVKQIAPGAQAFAGLKLPEAALLLPGDRFIIRQFSPVVTIGGGVVLDAAPVPRMPGRDEFLQILSAGNSEQMLGARVARRGQTGIARSRLIAETGWARTTLETKLARALNDGQIRRIGDLLVDASALIRLQQLVVDSVEGFQRTNPLAGGIAKEALRDQVKASPEVFTSSLDWLSREKRIEVGGDLVRLPGHGVVHERRGGRVKAANRRGFCGSWIESSGTPRSARRAQGGQGSRAEDRHAVAAGQSAGQDF